MVERLRTRRIVNVAVLFSLAIYNGIYNYVNGASPLVHLAYSGVFIISASLYIIIDVRQPQIHIISYIQFFIAFFSEVFGSPGIGIVLYLLAIKNFYLKKDFMIVLGTIIFVSVGLRFYAHSFNISQVFNNLILHGYLFYDWHYQYNSLLIPKQITVRSIQDLSEQDRQIIELQIAGKTYKEIAYTLSIAPSSVRGRAARARKRMGYETTTQMIIGLIKDGSIEV